MAESLERRLRAVEVAVEVQAEILTSIQAELIESDRLSSSVERLGDGASELGAALLQVDRNQQALTRLGQQLEGVQEQAATKDEIDEAKKIADDRFRRYHRRVTARARVAAVLGLAAIGTLGGILWHTVDRQNELDAEACQRAKGTRNAVVKYLSDVERVSTNPVLRDSAGEVVDAFDRPLDCEQAGG